MGKRICDRRARCVMQLKGQQQTNNGNTVRHRDHFWCTITCIFWSKRRHYENRCHIKKHQSEKLKHKEEQKNWGRDPKNPSRSGGGGITPSGLTGGSYLDDLQDVDFYLQAAKASSISTIGEIHDECRGRIHVTHKKLPMKERERCIYTKA